MVTDLDEFKNIRKIKIAHKELKEAVTIISDSIDKLKKYYKYIPVNESMSVLHNSRSLLEIHIAKFKRFLDENKNEIT